MGIEDLSLWVIALLFVAAVVAGYIDVLVGGGGLITIPALMLAGVPPIAALGTNKLQAVAGSGTSSFRLMRSGHLPFAKVRWFMLMSFAGAIVGTIVVQYLNPSLLNWLIPIVIMLIAFYFLFAANSTAQQQQRLSKKQYGASAVPAIGFYDGMFGPATGSFFVLAGVSLRGQNIVDSTVQAKSLNFASNFGSLLVFIVFGKLIWLIGAMMMVGQFIGASMGTRTLISINPTVLRYLVVVVSFVVLIAWIIRHSS